MGELKCGPFELDLEDKVRLYPSVGSDSQRRELARGMMVGLGEGLSHLPHPSTPWDLPLV